MRTYILDETESPIEVDHMVWAKWFSENDRQIARDTVNGILVSTVFLGLDHNFSGEGDPLIFETMIFGGEYDQELSRTSTIEDAKQCHRDAIAFLNGFDKMQEFKQKLLKENNDGQ